MLTAQLSVGLAVKLTLWLQLPVVFVTTLAGQLGTGFSNPELSWEYWNGAWSKLPLRVDQTLHLKNSGAVRFEIPDDIAATDWAGKTHFWVRARLIGGDDSDPASGLAA